MPIPALHATCHPHLPLPWQLDPEAMQTPHDRRGEERCATSYQPWMVADGDSVWQQCRDGKGKGGKGKGSKGKGKGKANLHEFGLRGTVKSFRDGPKARGGLWGRLGQRLGRLAGETFPELCCAVQGYGFIVPFDGTEDVFFVPEVCHVCMCAFVPCMHVCVSMYACVLCVLCVHACMYACVSCACVRCVPACHVGHMCHVRVCGLRVPCACVPLFDPVPLCDP